MKGRSGIWWLGIITAGVILGNTLSFGAYEAYSTWQINQTLKKTSQAMEKLSQETKEERYRQRIESEKLRKKQQRKQEINRRFRETCNFWIQQVKKESTPQNLQYRNTACAKIDMTFR